MLDSVFMAWFSGLVVLCDTAGNERQRDTQAAAYVASPSLNPQTASASGRIFLSPRTAGMISQYGSACVLGIAR